MATITNSNNKAVYIEFGVGAVAEATPHPDADLRNTDTMWIQDTNKVTGHGSSKVKGEDPVDLRSKELYA